MTPCSQLIPLNSQSDGNLRYACFFSVDAKGRSPGFAAKHRLLNSSASWLNTISEGMFGAPSDEIVCIECSVSHIIVVHQEQRVTCLVYHCDSILAYPGPSSTPYFQRYTSEAPDVSLFGVPGLLFTPKERRKGFRRLIENVMYSWRLR